MTNTPLGKYRGKERQEDGTLGGWVYGSLVLLNDEDYSVGIIQLNADPLNLLSHVLVEVDPETVGQFTGYFAAKAPGEKVELYDGDFCLSNLTLRPCEVFMKYGCWMFGFDPLDAYAGSLKLIGNRFESDLLSVGESNQ